MTLLLTLTSMSQPEYSVFAKECEGWGGGWVTHKL